MRKLDYFWKSNPAWWHWNENMVAVVNSDAPKEALESYARYQQQKKEDIS